jgi:hypothetical protein
MIFDEYEIDKSKCKEYNALNIKDFNLNWIQDDMFVMYEFIQRNKIYPYTWNTDDYYILYKKLYSYLTNIYPDYKILNIQEGNLRTNITIELKSDLIILLIGIKNITTIDYIGKYDENLVFSDEEYCIYKILLLYSPQSISDLLIVKDKVRKCMIQENNTKANIGFIIFNHGNYEIKEISIAKKLGEWRDLNLHYPSNGEMSFTDFYDGLKNKLLTTSKGLVLLYGQPGTGKSHFIRHIISDVSNMKVADEKNEKFFIYVQPRLISSILEPEFVTFLTTYIADNKREIVLIMEDAEQVLAKRELGNSGASNILNLTDGILNDILGFQVIATFNTDIDDIDTALLREGRLIASKKFSTLLDTEAKKLVTAIGLDIEITQSMTLAEIYAKKENNEVLQHNVSNEDEKKFGFIL